ncbi:uncharacterized protein Dvar_66770 [Desulfosarcina variabilis str. Montpellier]
MSDQIEKTMATDNNENEIEKGEETMIKETIDNEVEAEKEIDILTDMDEEKIDDTGTGSVRPLDFALTADSTSLSEITNIIVEDEGDLIGDADLIDEVDAFLDGETEYENKGQKLDAARDILRKYYAKHNQAWAGVVGTFSVYAIQQGRMLLEIKDLVKAIGETWETWAAENLQFMSSRTRQTFMQLAKVPGIDNHVHLGKERLLHLASATKDMGGEDPIGDLLKNHNLEINPEEEIDLDAYKDAVDMAIDFERLKRSGVEVKIETLQKFRADKKNVNNDLIKILKAIKREGGDPDHYLNAPQDDDEDVSFEGQKKAMNFTKIATSLVGTIKWINQHSLCAKKVDVRKIDELTESLNELKRLVTEITGNENQQ